MAKKGGGICAMIQGVGIQKGGFNQPGSDFSYAQDDSKFYDVNAPFFAGQINTYLQNTPDLIQH